MNTHKNARLTYVRRLEMARDCTERGMSLAQAARSHAVSESTARKWLGRYLAQGPAALADRSSRPKCSPRSIAPGTALAIVELRRKRLTHSRIAAALSVSKSTVGRVLARAGLSLLSSLEPPAPVQRYEHAAAGDLLHMDTKKLGRILAPGHRVTGDLSQRSRGAGWEVLFVAIDDHARIGFTDLYPQETQANAEQFLRNAVAYYRSLGVKVKRLLTDNGGVFRSKLFTAACRALGIEQKFTRPYRPQTNGKAERFIQSALREWAYAFTYQNSEQRTQQLDRWIHHYNWHRPHQGIHGAAPMSRLTSSRYNVLTLHT